MAVVGENVLSRILWSDGIFDVKHPLWLTKRLAREGECCGSKTFQDVLQRRTHLAMVDRTKSEQGRAGNPDQACCVVATWL